MTDFRVNPHDAFFKKNFEKREVIVSYIKDFLPKSLSQYIDIKTLSLDGNQYADNDLRQYFSDIVYNCKFKDSNAKLTLLFEHKSYNDQFIQFQILKYMTLLWNREINSKMKPSLILPVLFYNGEYLFKKKKINDFFSEVPDEFKLYIPQFDFHITDLLSCDDSFLKLAVESQRLKIVALLMKYIRNNSKLREIFHEILLDISKKYSEENKELLEIILNYMFYSSELDDDFLYENRDLIIDIGGSDIMTLAENLVMRGKKEGKLEGEREALLKTAEKMVLDGVDIKFIVKYTGLTKDEINSLKEK